MAKAWLPGPTLCWVRTELGPPHVASPQSGLTLLGVGLRISLARARVQQLLQLQRQWLRSCHGHRVSRGART